MGSAPDCNTEECVCVISLLLSSFILIFYVLECLNLVEKDGEREEEEDFSSEVKPPLSSRVLLSRATAQKSPFKEVLKIRFVLGDSRMYCFNINILFVPPQNAGLYHRFPMAVAPAFPRF